MSVFQYKAINASGQVVVDTMEGPTAGFISEQLDRLNYVPLQITEKKGMFAGKSGGSKKIDPKEVIVFTKQFATLFKAGVPLLSCLQALEEQAASEAMRAVIKDIAGNVQSGKTLYESMKPHKNAFSSLYVDMVRVGEAAGVLEEVLTRLVAFLTHDLEIKTSIKKATRYPIIVLVGIVIAFIVLILLVVPKFVDIFKK